MTIYYDLYVLKTLFKHISNPNDFPMFDLLLAFFLSLKFNLRSIIFVTQWDIVFLSG